MTNKIKKNIIIFLYFQFQKEDLNCILFSLIGFVVLFPSYFLFIYPLLFLFPEFGASVFHYILWIVFTFPFIFVHDDLLCLYSEYLKNYINDKYQYIVEDNEANNV